MTIPGDLTAVRASFTLPYAVINGVKLVTDEKAPVTLRFPARLLEGYCGRYAISIGEGTSATMCIHDTGELGIVTGEIKEWPAASRPAVYTDITIRPDHNWLHPGQQFAVFRIGLLGFPSLPPAETPLPPSAAADVLIGIQRPG